MQIKVHIIGIVDAESFYAKSTFSFFTNIVLGMCLDLFSMSVGFLSLARQETLSRRVEF